MKRYFLILIFIISFLFISCGKNDNNENTSEKPIDETSIIEESSTDEKSSISDDSTESTDCAPLESIGWGKPEFF